MDFQGRPLYLTLTPAQRHEMTKAHELLEHSQGAAFIGDSAYASKELARKAEEKGMRVVVGPHPKCKQGHRPADPELYRQRYLVEVFFHRLKRFRALATRYDKTSRSYLALLHLACAWLWLN